MSLYIGNLSAQTRREELERVFQRFGQCDVRLKDGYGFIVYSFAPQAEKAMKVLQGRNICGQQLTITWSNKQPRPFRRNSRAGRSYEQPGRGFGSRDVPSDYRNFRSRIRKPNGNHERLNSEERLDQDRDYREEETMVGNDFLEDERRGFRQDLPGDGDEVVPEIVDNGRWGERVETLSTDDDRYEPYHGYDKRDKDENRWIDNSTGSALDSDALGNLHNESKFQQNCYNCGVLGHKMRDCPKKHTSRRKFTRFDRRPDNATNRFRYKLEGTIRDNRTSDDSRELGTETRKRDSPETDSVRGKKHVEKKRRKRESESPKRFSGRKSRRSASTSFHSEYTPLRSPSASKSSKPRESKSRSLSSTSRTSSKSRGSKPENAKSRSSSVSPSNKAHLNHKEFSNGRSTPESKANIAGSENPKSDTKVAEANSGIPIAPSKLDSEETFAASLNACSNRSTSISLEEMCNALKHYGLELPEIDTEKKTSLEAYFGSARMWPWEGIYYRRVKKGPISVENYARRVAQNQEFGIVDRYIRSSSGWGERYKETPSP